jgi:2-polyprenyl-6-methoxyphenol hydroxylase-like FAD-dependent oxidoreductase
LDSAAKRSMIPVAIVGGGPVGLVLALFLDLYGVRSVLFNSKEGERTHPKGSTQNARTLEHFRRLGISEPVRRLGLPADHPTDVAYFTRFNAWELARIRMPSEAEKMRAVAAAPATDQVPEPILRANQMYVEDFLLDYARTRPNITLRFGWQVDHLAMEADGAAVEAERINDRARESWRVSYVVGCDGGQSFVRRMLGAHYRGFGALQQQYMGGRMIASHIRARTLVRSVLRDRHAWQYWSVTPEAQLMFASLNGRDEFLVFSQPPNPGLGSHDATVATMVQRAAGADVPLEMLGHRTWTGGVALVSERFGEGRVLLAGDAVHLFTPTGGFGMNTGIDDAANLSWKLAAMVHGWGGASLVDSYELERKPVAVRNTIAARELAKRNGTIPTSPAMEEDNTEGEAARRRVGAHLSTFGEAFSSIGLQLGVRYDGSPIIVPDGVPPADNFARYTPSSVPGGRAPHIWLDERRGRGSSLYDHLGIGFTLLRLGGYAVGSAALEAAALRRGIPLDVLHHRSDAARDLYERDLVLIRPDQHVAWRGNQPPHDPDMLWCKLVGAT